MSKIKLMISFLFMVVLGAILGFIQGYVTGKSNSWEGLRGKSTCEVKLLAACPVDRHEWLSYDLDVFTLCSCCDIFHLLDQITFSDSRKARILIGGEYILLPFIFSLAFVPEGVVYSRLNFIFIFTCEPWLSMWTLPLGFLGDIPTGYGTEFI